MSTLAKVIAAIKTDGEETRGSKDKKINSISAVTTQLQGIRADFDTFFQLQKQAANLAALADPKGGGNDDEATVTPTKTPAPDASSKKSLGLLGGLFGLIGGLGRGIGMGMTGLARGLVAFANPAILLGAGILGGAIVAIGAGIAGAAWITGKALPTFVEGMAHFEDLDGKKLIDAGAGIAAVGAGMAVFGVGGAAAGIGNIVSNISDGLVGLFGGKTPFDKLLEFQKYDFDKDKIKNNSEAMVAYGKAMASFGAGSTLEGIGAAVSAVGNGIAKFFGGNTELPFQKVVDFGEKYTFNKEKIQANAEALIAYSTAMVKYGALDLGASVMGAISAGADALTRFFGGDTKNPFQEVQDFGDKYTFNREKIAANAEALVSYSIAMAKYASIKAGGDIVAAVGSIGGAISALLGDDKKLPYDEMVKFGAATFNQKGIESNALALVAYGKAMSEYAQLKATGDLAAAGSSIANGITGLLGGDKSIPYEEMNKFAAATFNREGIETNAIALAAFGKAMADYAKTKPEAGFGDVLGSLASGISRLFGGETGIPYDEMRKFGEAKFNVEGIKNNAAVVSEFGKSMSALSGLKAIEETEFGAFGNKVARGIDALSRVQDDKLGRATNVIKRIREAFGVETQSFATAAAGASGEQIGQMSTQNAAAAGGGSTVVAPTTVGPTYSGPVYNGPVTINNDSSTSFGLNPNDRSQMAGAF